MNHRFQTSLAITGSFALLACTTAAVAAVGTAAGAAQAGYSAEISGQWAGVSASAGSGVLGRLLNAHLGLGTAELVVDSSGAGQVNGYALPAGVEAAARIDYVTAGILGYSPTFLHTEAAAPVPYGDGSTNIASLNWGPLAAASTLESDTSAAWGPSVDGPGQAGVFASAHGSIASVNLLDLTGGAGAFASLLPVQLRGPLVSIHATELHGSITSTLSPNGSHAIVTTGEGGLADLQLLGGAADGGITLGLFSRADGAQYVAGAKVWANGEPGGAGCSYTAPNTVNVEVGHDSAGVPVSIGQRIPLPGNLGYADVEFTGLAHCAAAADGTSASATGGGVGVRLHLQLPGGLGMADVMIALPDMDSAQVSVPAGGISS